MRERRDGVAHRIGGRRSPPVQCTCGSATAESTACLVQGAHLPPSVSFGGTFTFPEYRGRGEATMLVANFCAEMALSGLDVCLIVDDDNPAAIRAYAKVGFLPEGLYRTAYFLSAAGSPRAAQP